MTYDAREQSLQSGEPIELYQFNYGDNTYRYTTAKHDVLQMGKVWIAAPLKRNNISFSAEKGRNDLKIDTTRQLEIVDLYRIMPPSEVILLTLYRYHLSDSDAVVVWSGRVLAIEFNGSTAKISCEPVNTSLKRTGLRRLYQRQCPHVLYGNKCKVNKSNYAVAATLSSVSTTTLSSAVFSNYANDYFAGGYLDFIKDGVVERRFITDHKGAQLTINLPLSGLVAGSSITIYPGCDHTMPTCQTKFNNLLNYGGFPYIPQKNPFGSDGVY